MRPDLVLPVLALIVVLIVALVAVAIGLLRDGRQKRLLGRVETVSPAASMAAAEVNIRVAGHQQSKPAAWLARLVRMPVDMPKANVFPARGVIGLGVLLGLAVGIWAGPHLGWSWAAVAGLLIAILLPRSIFGWEWAKYQRTLLQQLPDAVEMVVSAVRAGLPVGDGFISVAIDMPSPTKDEFSRIVNEMAVGVAADQALLNVFSRTRVTEYAIFAVTISVQTRSGGKLVEGVQKLAETIRYRLAMATRAQALAGEARVSAIILGSLPFVAGAGLSALRPGYLDPLFHDPRGIRMLYVAIVGLLLGTVTMRQMIKKATSE
jgi:tight adherence protein B